MALFFFVSSKRWAEDSLTKTVILAKVFVVVVAFCSI